MVYCVPIIAPSVKDVQYGALYTYWQLVNQLYQLGRIAPLVVVVTMVTHDHRYSNRGCGNNRYKSDIK